MSSRGRPPRRVREATDQLEPERARSRNAITMASVMLDEIRLRAHARPIDGTRTGILELTDPQGTDVAAGRERDTPRQGRRRVAR